MNLSAILALLQNPQALSLVTKVPQLLALFQAPKDGVRTTEFWVTSVISAYALLAPGIPNEASIIITCVMGGAYVIGRSILKAAHAMGKLQNVNLPDLTADQAAAIGVPAADATTQK